MIDLHSHVGKWGYIDDEPSRYLRIMDAAGIDKAFVSCIFHGNHSRDNDVVAAFVSANPDRFGGVGFVTPHYPEDVVKELERAFDVLGMAYLKIYPDYYGRPVDDPGYLPIYEWCNDRGILIKCHSSYTSEADVLTAPRLFTPLAQRYTRIKWLLAHSGNLPQGQAQAVEAARACPNIYLETATSFANHGTIEYLVDGAGPDRVLFGSDMPLLDARMQVGRIITADLDDSIKKDILGLNAIRLLGLNTPTSEYEV